MCFCVIEISSVFPQKSSVISEISDNLRKCSEMPGNDCLDFGKHLENLRQTLRKCLKIFGKPSRKKQNNK